MKIAPNLIGFSTMIPYSSFRAARNPEASARMSARKNDVAIACGHWGTVEIGRQEAPEARASQPVLSLKIPLDVSRMQRLRK